MASLYNLTPATLFTVPTSDRITQCRLCHLPAIPYEDRTDINLGPLYQYGKPIVDDNGRPELEVYCAHYFCLLFSPGLETNGEDEEGIRGFLPEDIIREWRRGARLKCQFCDKKYATIGCCVGKTCRKTFHLPCGLRMGIQIEFLDGYKSFCIEHRSNQDVYAMSGPDLLDRPRECGVCLENLPTVGEQDEEERRRTLHTPCCNGWFHKGCAERAAEISGYFFKCPLCNNKDIFEHEMKKFGVYVPEQDAAWELEGDQFEELLDRHDRCDAEECVCPNGRQEDEDYTIWEILLCRYCGAQGIHVECAGLELRDDVTWKCPGCINVVKKLPPKPVHHLRKIGKKKSSQKRLVKGLLKKTDIRLSEAAGFSVNIKSKKFVFSIDPIAKVSVPKPVQLSKKSSVQNGESTSQAALESTSASTSEILKTPAKDKPSKLFMEFFVTDPSEMSPNNALFEDSVFQNELGSENIVSQNVHANINTPVKFPQKSPSKLMSDVLKLVNQSEIETVHHSPVLIGLCKEPIQEVSVVEAVETLIRSPEKASVSSQKQRGRPTKKERASVELEICSSENSTKKVDSYKNKSLSSSKLKKKEIAKFKIKPQVLKDKCRDMRVSKEATGEGQKTEIENKVESSDDCMVMDEICSIFTNKTIPRACSEEGSSKKVELSKRHSLNSSCCNKKASGKGFTVEAQSQIKKRKSHDGRVRKEVTNEKDLTDNDNKRDSSDDDCMVIDEICSIFESKRSPGAKSKSSKSPDSDSKENQKSSSVKSPKKSKTTPKPVFKRKSCLENSDQPPEKRPKSDEKSVKRKSCEKLKVKLNSNANQNKKRLSTGSDITSPKPDLISPVSDQNKNVKTKKHLKKVDPNQKSILQYFLSPPKPV